MLQQLYVKNLALIDEIEVEFKDGLNILTGETGAGKSIILGSIHLALGGRYSADIIRKGSEFGLVELIFTVDQALGVALKKYDVFPEDGLLILSRKFMEGRSLSKVNGETVPMSMLKNIASLLIDIHGQHEHQTLLNKKNHLLILDEYIGQEIEVLKATLSKDVARLREKETELQQQDYDEEKKNRELDFLKYEWQEIDTAKLVMGEDDELELEYRKMVNGKKIMEHAAEAYEYTSEQNASDYLSRGLKCLQEVIAYDETCNNIYEQLLEIDNLLHDYNRELQNYMDEFEFSDEVFQEVEERLNTWNRMKEKYGHSYEDIMEYQQKCEENIAKLENYESYIANLEHEIAEINKTIQKQCETITNLRKKYAKKLVKEIVEKLKELNFTEVIFDLHFEMLSKPSSKGIDDVAFYVSLNKGEESKPLMNVASGGELSRIMLAIKTVMSDKENVGTVIFDEIDAGISGRTAERVGEMLRVIGEKRQVICITHLAQIAAMSTEHYLIEKKVVKGKTNTQIVPLTEEESIDELTRILGGSKITETMRESAIEMKKMAKNQD